MPSTEAFRLSFIASHFCLCSRLPRCRSPRSISRGRRKPLRSASTAIGFFGILNSTRLELLLERHRRIVESMPSEVDRDRLQSGRNELGQIKQRLSELIDRDRPGECAIGASLESRIAGSLPALFEAADQVAFYANEFAQDKAVEEANDYVHIANGIERLIKNYRDLRLEEAQEAIAFVSATTKSLAIWVLLSAFVAIVLIGPIGLDHHAPGAVAARAHHPGDDAARPPRHHHRRFRRATTATRSAPWRAPWKCSRTTPSSSSPARSSSSSSTAASTSR